MPCTRSDFRTALRAEVVATLVEEGRYVGSERTVPSLVMTRCASGATSLYPHHAKPACTRTTRKPEVVDGFRAACDSFEVSPAKTSQPNFARTGC